MVGWVSKMGIVFRLVEYKVGWEVGVSEIIIGMYVVRLF